MRRLYLSKTDKKIFGVCGGIGETYDIDLNPFNEIAVQLGVLPPTEKGVGRLLGEMERRHILAAYRSVNGEDDEKDPDL